MESALGPVQLFFSQTAWTEEQSVSVPYKWSWEWCQTKVGWEEDTARNRIIRIQYDSRERNVEKRNTNISISAEAMNSTNTSKQLSRQEACNTEIGT